MAKDRKRKKKRSRQVKTVTDAPTPARIIHFTDFDGPSIVLIDFGYVGSFPTRKAACDWAHQFDPQDWWVFPVSPPS